MGPTITLVLADTEEDAEAIITQERLNPVDTACVTEPSYLDYIRLKPGEKIYMSANCNQKFMAAVQSAATRDLGSGQNIKLCIINKP